MGSIRQFENGNSCGRVFCQKLRCQVFTRGNVHLDKLDIIKQALLGQCDADPGRIGEPFVFVNLHDRLLGNVYLSIDRETMCLSSTLVNTYLLVDKIPYGKH